MSSIKQIRLRLLNKKNSLNKVNSEITHASKSTNTLVLRRLDQEKLSLNKDIKNLERQLVTIQNASRN